MLHIHNGDASANTAKQSSLPGEHFAWREALIDGPTPAGLEVDEWRTLRASHLSDSYGVDRDQCEQDLRYQEEKLASFGEHDEVVLWFEHDLFCQVHLIYLLQYFAQQDLGKTRLSLVCINEFPGRENFRGLGELTAEQLASLFPARQQVTHEQLDLGTAAWKAYSSSDPGEIQTLLDLDTAALPFLNATLKAHLRRFPSTKNGLGAIENRGLQLVRSGLNRFEDLFRGFGEAEPIYGLGDCQFWQALRRMREARQPLLSTSNGHRNELESGVVTTTEFESTDLGEAVLRGDADFVALNGIDLWLGGVHLNDERNLWRWDEGQQKLVFT
ncbi:MAG: RNA polymerase subunit sigma-24 [Acidobacteriota bacterium]|nr:RNA polymerase subunit sigma-24 [Acidobacteriota bacterium]